MVSLGGFSALEVDWSLEASLGCELDWSLVLDRWGHERSLVSLDRLSTLAGWGPLLLWALANERGLVSLGRFETLNWSFVTLGGL